MAMAWPNSAGDVEGVDAAADDARRRLDRAALPADPPLAHADGGAAGKLHLALRNTRQPIISELFLRHNINR